MKEIMFIITYLICTVGGLTFLKLGSESFKFKINKELLISMNWEAFLGFALYIISFLLWQKLIGKYNITKIFPITAGIVQIAILIIGIYLFKEKVSIINIMGTLLTIMGIILISMK